jgi:hypothetical protein
MTELVSNPFSVQIIYEEPLISRDDAAKGLFAAETRIARQVASLDLALFSANLQTFCQQIGSVFDGVPTVVSSFELGSFELTLDVTAKGEVRFIGSAGTEIKGGLKIVFQRKR